MADPDKPTADLPLEADEVETNQALEQGLGVGARELAAIHESGAEGTLERGDDPASEDGEGLDADENGRSASVLDRK
ncbi:MAG: hypothetical protein ACRED4_05555 [Brevundimonas sp.]